jgi:parvulin-like peptidyl-prolyl isomerase
MMNLKYSVLVIILLNIVFSTFVYSQNDKSVVAQVGNDKITAREFKLRLELAPYIPKDQNIPKDSIKYDLLYSLIAEKIWALKAKEEGIENTQEFNFFFKPIEDLFVRDALFKQEIENKVSITTSEMEKGIYKSQFTQVIRFFSSADSASIFRLHKQLNKTSNLDSLINMLTSIEDTTINVKFGDLGSEAIEDTIYSLKKGYYSTLQKTKGGYLIYYCVDNIFTPLNLGDQQIVDGINKIIRSRKLEILYNDYRNDLLTGTNIKINPKTILLLSNSIWEKLKLKSSTTENEQTYFELSEKDFQDILTSFTDKELKLPLFNLKNKTINLYDFLSRTAYLGFSIPQLDSNLVVSKLAFTSKLFVEEQILTEEGYKKAYNLLPPVQNDLKIWKQKYLAQMYMISQLESIKVTDEQLRDYYYNVFNKHRTQIFVKLKIITLNDLDEVSKVLDKMNTGISFSDIAKGYGKTDSLVNENGETEWLPISMLNDLSDITTGLHKGEIFGPFKRNVGYSIVQLVDRVEKSDSTLQSFEQIKNQLTANLRFKILNDMLNETTSKSALQQNVKIFNEVVDKITTTQIPMFVHRFMGFGGRMAGIPLTTPFSGWINSEIKQKLLP